jgi:[ribosomal protein S5]-alanine N-acetyltransferase
MIFETERLYVTKWKSDDLQALHELYNDTAIKESISPQLTIEETQSIFEKQIILYNNHLPFGRYFIVEKFSNKFIGILLFKKDDCKKGVEIGYSLKKNQWKKGYATEVVRESINWIFESKGFSSMYAITGSENESSKNVLLKCGFISKEYFTENGEDLNLFNLNYSDS